MFLSTGLQNRLRNLEDMINRKEEMLRSRFRDTHTAMLWLRNNRDLFEGNVYEPMMLVVRVVLLCEVCVCTTGVCIRTGVSFICLYLITDQCTGPTACEICGESRPSK